MIFVDFLHFHRSTKRAVLLENKECGGGCGGFGRNFVVNWELWIDNSEDKALLPAFFDLTDDVSLNRGSCMSVFV